MRLSLLLVCLCVLTAVIGAPSVYGGVHSIDDYGGIAGRMTDDAGRQNAVALLAALSAAAHEASLADRVALVPAGRSYYMFPVAMDSVANLTLQIDGTLVASDNITAWSSDSFSDGAAACALLSFSLSLSLVVACRPFDPNGPYISLLTFTNTHGVSIVGRGAVNGKGYEWWEKCILNELREHRHRPYLLHMLESSQIFIRGLRLYDSPSFHIYLKDVVACKTLIFFSFFLFSVCVCIIKNEWFVTFFKSGGCANSGCCCSCGCGEAEGIACETRELG